LKVTLLGTGGPRPDPRRQGPGTLVQIGEDKLLFDAGRGVATQIVRAGVEITDVGHVFVTHHHFDHTGGLADVLFAAWNKARNETIRVYGPEGTREMVGHLFNAYERDIDYRLRETELTVERLVDIRDMVEVVDVGPGLVHAGEGWEVHADHVDHGHRLGFTTEDWPCLGYRVEAGGRVVAVSGDAVDSPGLQRIASGADLLVQCCYLVGEEIVDDDLRLIADHVLASSTTVGKIAAKAGVKRLALVHIKEKSDELLRSMAEEIRRDFDGDVIVGEDLMEIEV
jgi:ribonuclease BN (tRNA processing enzyme)